MRAIFAILILTVPAFAADPPVSNEEIKKTVDSHLDDVKACLREKGKATGKLVVEFAIKPDGSVENPRPKEASSNAALDKCIAAAFQKWTFPKPRGGALAGAIYPFVFSVPPPPPPAVPLKTAQIVEVFKSKEHLAEISECVKQNKGKDTKDGLIKFAVVVASDGKVKEAKVLESNTKIAKLDECLLGKLKAWTFPKADESAFNYPLSFKLDND